MNKVRIKIELVVDTDLNVSEVRKRLEGLSGRAPDADAITQGKIVLGDIAALVSGEQARCLSHSASYNTPWGRKP